MAGAEMAPSAPIKLCPSCRAQNQTFDDKCPSCGKRFKKRKKWPWILVAVFVLFGGCAAMTVGGLNSAVNELNKEQAAHAITPSQFDAVEIGTSKSDVIAQLGKEPEDAQEFVSEGIFDEEEINSSCIYYNKQGGSFGDSYQFCFDGDSLSSKNAY